ncbi:MAG: multicopper oxidase domain-containing protein [Halobacteriales archaeon]
MTSPDERAAARTFTELERRLRTRLARTQGVTRRSVLGGVAGGLVLANGLTDRATGNGGEHGMFGPHGEFEDPFDPHAFLRTFNTGSDGQADLEQEVYNEDGRLVRHFHITVLDRLDPGIEIVPGVYFPAWTFNGQVPGPTLRAVEGDLIRITMTNGSRHAHTMHPHLRNHRPEMDGIPQTGPGVIQPGETYTYDWVARPPGVHFYHCHALPLKEHLHRGMYGVVVVDPDPERVRDDPRAYVNHPGPLDDAVVDELVERARERNHTYPENDAVDELVMVMNSFDTDFDGENEVYAVNTRAFAYGVGETDGAGSWRSGETRRPIQIDPQQRQLVYLVNTTEFDPINSFHSHSQFFDYYDHGTTLWPTHRRVDTIVQTQAQRGILELDYREHEPGLYMFHAHQSEFAELGWMSFFEVIDG